MDDMVEAIINGEDTTNSLRYMVYSAHDTQLINLLDWLSPVDREYLDTGFSAVINFELFYDSDCLAENPGSKSCFTVKVIHDNHFLKFDTCLESNIQKGSGSLHCEYQDFLTYIGKIAYKGDAVAACQDPFTPPQ